MAPVSRNAAFRNIRFSPDWITRPLFGLLLAALVVLATVKGPQYLALFVAAGAAFCVREWHRMVRPEAYRLEMAVSASSICLALASLVLWPRGPFAWTVLAAGAVVAASMSIFRRASPLWQGGGVLYIGAPALALVAVRAIAQDGAWLVIGLFLIVWATDTGALVAGNLVGGPKLAPALSPNKTWAGTLGGVAAAAIVEAIYIEVLGGNPFVAGVYGAGLAVIAHAGDLFESWAKRRFSRKDSGSLIPGHGGALDRVDSTLSAALALAILVLGLKANLLFGARP
ncbi:MAG TPA: phosphatidate cytidylyltransferase [Rhizomicrobium sp.]|jgi:phosphatidate cytidylyltransferase|nr:phosphatidate cytidylyltransferase [Rhizomicrobium sp.]